MGHLNERDTTIAEIHKIRQCISDAHRGDIHAITEDARKRQEESGRPSVSFADSSNTAMRPETIRADVQRLINQVPFRAFALSMENGNRIVVEHPENIAFDPAEDDSNGSADFYVISRKLRVFSTFEAVTSVALLDAGGQIA